jgi:hypothetical protein
MANQQGDEQQGAFATVALLPDTGEAFPAELCTFASGLPVVTVRGHTVRGLLLGIHRRGIPWRHRE